MIKYLSYSFNILIKLIFIKIFFIRWELELVDYAVPMSPQEAVTKRHAIFKHAS